MSERDDLDDFGIAGDKAGVGEIKIIKIDGEINIDGIEHVDVFGAAVDSLAREAFVKSAVKKSAQTWTDFAPNIANSMNFNLPRIFRCPGSGITVPPSKTGMYCLHCKKHFDTPMGNLYLFPEHVR